MTRSNQRGGTLLGLMVGVLISVLVAVAVAVYVARIPVPFVDRVGSDKDSNPADLQQGGDWNPNASLRGSLLPDSGSADGSLASGSVVPAPGVALIPDPAGDADALDLAPLPPPAEAQASAPPSVPTPDPVDRAAPASGDPLGDLMASRNRPEPVVARTRGGDPFVYFVQAGAFRTPQDADAQRARLLLAGVHARVTPREQAGRTVYRVRVGPFDERGAADTVLAQLGQGGFDAALVRVQR